MCFKKKKKKKIVSRIPVDSQKAMYFPSREIKIHTVHTVLTVKSVHADYSLKGHGMTVYHDTSVISHTSPGLQQGARV